MIFGNVVVENMVHRSKMRAAHVKTTVQKLDFQSNGVVVLAAVNCLKRVDVERD